jgi:hypothetical protein
VLGGALLAIVGELVAEVVFTVFAIGEGVVLSEAARNLVRVAKRAALDRSEFASPYVSRAWCFVT